jgi:4-hydroxy-2-oxoheptanedioate aldolase
MSPQLVELYGLVGLDFVILGTEVEAMDSGRLEDLMRAAAAARTTAIVKLRRPDPALVSEALTFGSPMVMVPHITSARQLEEMTRASRFPPHGTRGECPVARYNGYGSLLLADTYRAANEARTVIPIIEDREALVNLDEIMAVDDFDIVEIGPFDLSRSLGGPGLGFDSPKVQEAIDRVADAALAHGKRVCMPLWEPPEADTSRKLVEWQLEHLVARGVSLLYVADTTMLADLLASLMPMRGARMRVEELEADRQESPATGAGAPSGRTPRARIAAQRERPASPRPKKKGATAPRRQGRSSTRRRSPTRT